MEKKRRKRAIINIKTIMFQWKCVMDELVPNTGILGTNNFIVNVKMIRLSSIDWFLIIYFLLPHYFLANGVKIKSGSNLNIQLTARIKISTNAGKKTLIEWKANRKLAADLNIISSAMLDGYFTTSSIHQHLLILNFPNQSWHLVTEITNWRAGWKCPPDKEKHFL